MTISLRLSSLLLPAVIAALLSGCIFLPGGTVTHSATVVYTAGSRVALTADVQYIQDPALNPTESSIWMLNLRGRITF